MALINTCLIVFGALALIVFATDQIVAFNNWQRRIHIGRWREISEWKNAVKKQCDRWLKRTPIVPKLDNEKLILIDCLKGEYQNATIHSWQLAGLILGLATEKNYTFNYTTIRNIINRNCKSKNPESALLAYSMLQIKSIIPELSKEIDSFASDTYKLIASMRQENATIPYRNSISDIRFVDTLGFICPFLTYYGLINNNKSIVNLAEIQIREYLNLLHPDTGLPPHAYDIKSSLPLGCYDWGRGAGWMILALVECHDTLSKWHSADHTKFKDIIAKSIITLSDRILLLQRNDGGYSAFLCHKQGRLESTATVLCALLLEKAYTLSKNLKYKTALDKTIKCLMTNTQRDGALDYCQGDTKGIGMYSNIFRRMPFAQGILLKLINNYNEDSKLF